MRWMPTPLPLLLALVAVASAACHSGPSEPLPPAPAPSTRESGDPTHAETYRIVQQDHRHVIPLRVDDRIALPDDPAFDWRIEFEDRSAFAAVADAGGAPYRVTKAGPFRTMVYGDPKCLKTDAGCGLSYRRWDVTFSVK